MDDSIPAASAVAGRFLLPHPDDLSPGRGSGGRRWDPTVTTSLHVQLAGGIAARDPAAIAACFSAAGQLRARVPPGLRERRGADGIAALIWSWFADSTKIDLLETGAEHVSDRLHLWYRFGGIEDGAPYLVEQHLYGITTDGVIASADLLCSGFRPG
jgi:hypothetical protein